MQEAITLQQDLIHHLSAFISPDRIKHRLIDLIAYAADAGFYHLQPKVVVQPVSEMEVIQLMNLARQLSMPYTFRAGGTSLSGQSITDGILIDLSRFWRGIWLLDEGRKVRVQPGITGGAVNAYLKPHRRKIGPDPASINSAMIGGILSNNASGMCCGVKHNAYHTISSIRFILPNGNRFNTAQLEDFERFEEEEPFLSTKLLQFRQQILENETLQRKIRRKYLTKNTVGYALNAFIDFDQPLAIFEHLLIGGEGTLGFIAEAELNTIPDYQRKATAMLYFNTIYDACQAIVPLTQAGAEAVELMDRASLRSIEHLQGAPTVLKLLPAGAAALLVEFQADEPEALYQKIERFRAQYHDLHFIEEPQFTQDPVEQASIWKLRKGMFPAVGAVRQSGSTVILEDIAFPVSSLGDAILDLQKLFVKHGYANAIIFGHAKDGNIHFVVTQLFDTKDEIIRYDRFIRDVVDLVVKRYDGALKAEHGTGRNMAPFIETEWGSEAYAIMKALKTAVDPENLLNPGVIINPLPDAHIQNLKALPPVDPEVDRCMECGFCEYVCPSRDITLTPRQRIVVRRGLAHLQQQANSKAFNTVLNDYKYDGLDTCAVDGLCGTACPVDINTGTLVKRLRLENHSKNENRLALSVAKNFSTVTQLVGFGLKTAKGVNTIFGSNSLLSLTKGLKKIIPAFPLWSNQIRLSDKPKHHFGCSRELAEVVYYPTCISKIMGGSGSGRADIIHTFLSIAKKAGVNVYLPQKMNWSCCGQIFSSKGFTDAYQHMANKTISALWTESKEGAIPVVTDISSCTYTLQNSRPILTNENQLKFDQLRFLDSVTFIHDYIIPRKPAEKQKEKIVIHPGCAVTKMGVSNQFVAVSKHYAKEVQLPVYAGCCGMAGDRGFLFPELTAAAAANEAKEVRQETYDGHYASAKTCEMALSEATGKEYDSLIYLVDDCI